MLTLLGFVLDVAKELVAEAMLTLLGQLLFVLRVVDTDTENGG